MRIYSLNIVRTRGFLVPPRDANKEFLLGGLPQDFGLMGGHAPHQEFDGGSNFPKNPKISSA